MKSRFFSNYFFLYVIFRESRDKRCHLKFCKKRDSYLILFNFNYLKLIYKIERNLSYKYEIKVKLQSHNILFFINNTIL